MIARVLRGTLSGGQKRESRQCGGGGGGGGSGSKTKSVAPFILGESLQPIPANLVSNIQKGEFVNMAEPGGRRNKNGTAIRSAGQLAHSRQEVLDNITWIWCFDIYTCIVTAAHLEKMQ